MEPGQGIRFAVPRNGAVRQGEIELVKQEGPPGLPGVEALCRPEVLQVPMIRPDEEWDHCPSSRWRHSSNASFKASSSRSPIA